MSDQGSPPETSGVVPVHSGGAQTPIRQDLVETAVRFLQNPKVQQTPIEQRRAFLVRKGLSSSEVEEALRRSNSFSNQQLIESFGPQFLPPPQQTTWRDYASVAVIVSGASYGIYKVVRFFGVPDPEREQLRHLEEKVEELQNSMKFVMDSVQQTLDAVQQQQPSLQRALTILADNNNDRSVLSGNQVQELKTEIGVVKSLLLSRNQFPPLPNETPSVPAWQLQAIRSTSSASSLTKPPPKFNPTVPSASTQNGYTGRTKNAGHVHVENGQGNNSELEDSFSDDEGSQDSVGVRNGPGKNRKIDLEPQDNEERSTPV